MEVAKMNKLKNIHPGEVLLEEFLVPMGLSQNRIAREIGVPPRRINEIVHGKRSITADTANLTIRPHRNMHQEASNCCSSFEPISVVCREPPWLLPRDNFR